MSGVRVAIVRFTSDWQPGFVECEITDLSGRVWTFSEKVPLVTDEYLDAASAYPCLGTIGCEVLEVWGDSARVRIDHLCSGSEIDSDSLECVVPRTALVD